MPLKSDSRRVLEDKTLIRLLLRVLEDKKSAVPGGWCTSDWGWLRESGAGSWLRVSCAGSLARAADSGPEPDCLR